MTDQCSGRKECMTSSPIRMESLEYGHRATNVKATWHPYGLSELQGILNGNILRSTFGLGQGTLVWEESHEIRTFIRILIIRKGLSAQGT